jgi:hypothetical protein
MITAHGILLERDDVLAGGLDAYPRLIRKTERRSLLFRQRDVQVLLATRAARFGAVRVTVHGPFRKA